MTIQVELTGVEQLERLAERLNRFSAQGMMRRLGEVVKMAHVERVLSGKKAPDGKPWAELKPSTIERKGSTEIMVQSGNLANSFVEESDYWMSRISNSAQYAIFQQAGTSRMEARPIMGLSPENLIELTEIANKWVGERLGGVR